MATWKWLGDIQAGTSGQRVATGAGSPEGVVTAPIGSVYLRSDGSTNSAVYIKETGAGNIGWAAIGAGGSTVSLRHNGSTNGSQAILDLIAGSGVTVTDNGVGGLTLATTSGGPGSMSVSHAIQSSPLTVNLSTQGTYDWMWIGEFLGGALAGNLIENTNIFRTHWKLLNGRLLGGFRFVPNTQLSDGSITSSSRFTYNSNAGDDASMSDIPGIAGSSPMANRQSAFFFNNNSNTNFFPFGFQWRDIQLATTAARVLKFYIYVNNCTVTFSARLSDGSAADVTTTITAGGTEEHIITLNVTPGNVGATLSAALLVTTFANSASSVGISAVTMA